MLKFDQLILRRGSLLLLEEATFLIHPGQHVGITGINGCGKSSLFALIRGELHADAGEFHCPANWKVAYVAQETPTVTISALEYVLAGDSVLTHLRAELAAAEIANDGPKLAHLHAQWEALHGYSAESRAARLLNGLGFSSDVLMQPVAQFSGGWRMRLNLAQALMCPSDLLLLDEPTNHLDLDAIIWLEDWLRHYSGTLLLISHDREFLDAVVSFIVHIEQHRAILYRGDYSAFERQRAARFAQQQSAYEKQQREILHIQQFVERFRAKATKARQAQSRLKALERMERILPAHIDAPVQFNFRPPERLPTPLLQLEQVGIGYGESLVLHAVNLTLMPGDRIGLLGANGAGKSTLIRLLAGELTAQIGVLESAPYLRCAYFAQHQLEQLRLEESPLWHLQHQAPDHSEQILRDFLGSFGFGGERVQMPVGVFSGGEKARLVLALLAYARPNLLLLDEPTNHLDLEMRLALSQALQEYAGAVVLVSHDRHLLRVTVDQLLLVHAGRVQLFDGDLDDYPAWLTRQRATNDKPNAPENEYGAPARKEKRRQDAIQRQRLQPLRAQLKSLEQELNLWHTRQCEMQQQLSQATLYTEAKKDDLRRCLEKQREINQTVARIESEWLAIGEALEQQVREV